jgi:hypothetical protein
MGFLQFRAGLAETTLAVRRQSGYMSAIKHHLIYDRVVRVGPSGPALFCYLDRSAIGAIGLVSAIDQA